MGTERAGRAVRSEPDRLRERKAGQPAERMGCRRRGRPEHPGLRDRHQRQPRRNGPLQDQDRLHRPTTSTSTGWATTAATAPARSPRSSPRRACRRPSRPADEEASTGLIDCGNWAESASWAVPADAVSGIYFAKLVRDDQPSEGSHIIFVVRDDDRPLRSALSDIRHDLGGLQPLRAATASTPAVRGIRRDWSRSARPRLQGQLQPSADGSRRRPPKTIPSMPNTRWSAGSSATATTSATSPRSTRIVAAPRF